MYNNKINPSEVREFVDRYDDNTKIYIGCDSERFRIRGDWYADYILAVVVHMNGQNGGKIFGEIQRERDYDQRASKPTVRLMTEVYKISELYLNLADILADRYVEIHLDLNPNDSYASNSVAQQAIGYIRGVCNVEPLIKPKAWAASYCADRWKGLRAAGLAA